jgi:predicted nuclease with TOPRIM domain
MDISDGVAAAIGAAFTAVAKIVYDAATGRKSRRAKNKVLEANAIKEEFESIVEIRKMFLSEMEAARNEMIELHGKVLDAHKLNIELQERLKQRDLEIAGIKERLNKKDDEIVALRLRVDELTLELQNLKNK